MSKTYIELFKYCYCSPKMVEIFHRQMNEKALAARNNKGKRNAAIKKWRAMDEKEKKKIDVMPNLFPRIQMNLKAELLHNLMSSLFYLHFVDYNESTNTLIISCLSDAAYRDSIVELSAMSSHPADFDDIMTGPLKNKIVNDFEIDLSNIHKMHLQHSIGNDEVVPVVTLQDMKILLR